MTAAQDIWNKFMEDIKGVKGWPYPEPFHQYIGFFQEAVRSFACDIYDGTVTLSRAVIDGAIFECIMFPPLSNQGEFICDVCGEKIEGGLNGLNAHKLAKVESTKYFWEQRRNQVNKLHNDILEDFSTHISPKRYTDFTDTWKDGKGMVGLENLAFYGGLFTKNELTDIHQEIRRRAAIRLHKNAEMEEINKWREDNKEKLEKLQRNEIDASGIDWFSAERATYTEALKVLEKVGGYLAIVVNKYGKIWEKYNL